MANELPPWLLHWLIFKAQTDALSANSPSGGPVTFPTTDLSVRVRLGVGQSSLVPADLSADPESWNWIDITRYVRYNPGINIHWGMPRDSSDTVIPGSMTLTLDNNASTDPADPYPQAGRFSRRNPNSPFYGLLTRNTPIWVQVDPGSGFVTRAQMFVNEWPKRWTDKSGNDSTVTIACGGILRRLSQATALRSPLYQAITGDGSAVAFWELDDGADSITAASDIDGGQPMTTQGAFAGFGATGPDGAAGAVDLSGGGVLRGKVTGASATSWSIGWAAASTESDDASYLKIVLGPGGTYAAFAPHPQGPLFGAGVNAVTPDGTFSGPLSATRDESLDSDFHWYVFTAAQDGGNIDLELFRDGVSLDGDSVAGTLSAPVDIALNMGVVPVDPLPGSMSSVVVWSGAPPDDYTVVMNGRPGESVNDRIVRVCAGHNVSLHCVGSSTPSPPMGPQPSNSFLDVVRDAETAGQGVIYEYGFGLGYQTRDERTNQPVWLALDFDARHIAETPIATDDDRELRNRWTVSRPDGSEYTHELTTGPMGTGEGGPGIWPDSIQVNVEDDDQLRYQASYRVHRDIVDEDRWSSVALNLMDAATAAELIPALVTMPFGARVTVANLPTQWGPGAIDVTFDGLREFITPKEWRVSLVCNPNTHNHTTRLAAESGDADEWLGYLIPDRCVLAVDVDDTTTSVQITTVGALWSEDSDDWTPGALVVVGGEQMLVTGVTGSSNPQTLTVTRSVNGVVKSHSAGAALEFVSPGVLGL